MSRKIKDIKDRHTGELVYPRTHVSAVVLSSDSTLEDLVEVKQDKINDLDEIRTGAAKGATALQSVPSEYVTETELSNKGYATISALNNKVDVINGKQLSTEDFTTALKNKLEGLRNYDDTELSEAIENLRGDFDNIVSGDTTTAIKTFNEVIAFLDGLTDTQDLESIIANIEQQIAGKMDKVTLAKVATSGNYNDLSNKPTIPAAVTENTVSGWGFTKNTGTYSKPSGGIPKTDLASAVQTSLGKADTALQSYTEQYKGTITGVSANGTSVATSGVANIPAASTSAYGVTKLSSATNSTSTTLAATASAVKSAYDLANSYKGTVTGVKINGTTKNPSSGVVDLGTVITEYQPLKTINGESIIGSGDIEISGGGSVEWETAPGFAERDYWCVLFDPVFNNGGQMSPNKIYVVPNLTVGSLDLSTLEHVNDYGDEYRIIFKTHDTYPPVSIDFSEDYNIVYENGIEPEFKANTWYDVRLIRTVHESAQQLCVIATEFSNQPSSGGSSDANVQAVDTGDVIDDVTVNYATKTYVDGLVGDINSILESIINS